VARLRLGLARCASMRGTAFDALIRRPRGCAGAGWWRVEVEPFPTIAEECGDAGPDA